MDKERDSFEVTKEERAIRRFAEALAKALRNNIQQRELTLEAAKLRYRVEVQAYSIVQYHPDIAHDESIDLAIDIVGAHDAAIAYLKKQQDVSEHDSGMISWASNHVRKRPSPDRPGLWLYEVDEESARANPYDGPRWGWVATNDEPKESLMRG